MVQLMVRKQTLTVGLEQRCDDALIVLCSSRQWPGEQKERGPLFPRLPGDKALAKCDPGYGNRDAIATRKLEVTTHTH